MQSLGNIFHLTGQGMVGGAKIKSRKSRRGGVGENVKCSCRKKEGVVQVSTPDFIRLPPAPENTPDFIRLPPAPDLTTGGKHTSKASYKARLEKKSVESLYKMAKKLKISITTKRDGKTKYIKKDTVVKKLVDNHFSSRRK